MDKILDDALPGEVLAEDILDSSGRLLFPEGAKLTEASIKALRQREVVQISVVGERIPLNVELLKKATERARKFYEGQDLAVSPGPILLGLRTEAEARRLEERRPPLLQDIQEPLGDVPSPSDLPLFCLNHFQPPELPAVVHELNRALAVPDPSSQTVADVIGRSPGLTARLLRLVNTPLFGLQGKVGTVSRAVALVGLREIAMLASGMIMVEQFGVIPRSLVDMRSFLEHSLGCALAAKSLAAATGDIEPEQAFVAGLLHDIGRLYFFTSFPERSRYCIDSSLKHGRPMMQEELLFFGADHAMVGERILNQWHMPPTLQDAVAHHHDPFTSVNPLFPCIVHLADVLVHAMGLGCSGDFHPPAICPGILDLVRVSPESLVEIAAGVEDRLETIVAAFQ